MPQKSAFSGAGRADQPDNLALMQGERHVIQRNAFRPGDQKERETRSRTTAGILSGIPEILLPCMLSPQNRKIWVATVNDTQETVLLNIYDVFHK